MLKVLCIAAVTVSLLLATPPFVLAEEQDPSSNVYSVADMLELCEIRNDFDKESSVICDPAGVIEFYHRNEIEKMFDSLVVTRFNVIVVPGIADIGYRMLQSKINIITHQFALRLFNDLNIVKDSGSYDRALIFISRAEQSAAVICDADMLPKISPEELEEVTQKAIEYVVKDEINVAIESTIRRLNLVISADGNIGTEENLKGHKKKARFLKASFIAPKVFLGLFFIFSLYAMFERNVDNQLVKGKVTLGQILDELNRSEQPSSLKHRRASCPTCLDRFTIFDGNQGGLSGDAMDSVEEITDTTEDHLSESVNVDDVTSSSRRIDVNEFHGCLLACGHEFCQTCLQIHLLPKNNMLCPVCLQTIGLPSEYIHHNSSGNGKDNDSDEVDVDEDSHGDNAREESSALLTSIHAGTDHKEILYRLERIKHLYPRVMSAALLLKCQTAAKENDLALIRDAIQMRFSEISADLTSRENLLKESVLGDKFALSRAHASRT